MKSHPKSFPLLNRITYYEKRVEANEIDVQFYEGESYIFSGRNLLFRKTLNMNPNSFNASEIFY